MNLFNFLLSIVSIKDNGMHISYSKQRDDIDNEKFQVTLLYKTAKRVRLFVGSSVLDLKIEESVFSRCVKVSGGNIVA